MKVILIKDDPKHGKRGETIHVSDGFARNYLLPRKMAVQATPTEEARFAKLKVQEIAQTERGRSEAEEIKIKLEGAVIEIRAKAGEKGKLFGSVTAEDIAEAVQRNVGIEIDKKKIKLGSPIHMIGEHRVSVKLHSEVEGNLVVKVAAG